MVVLMLGAKHTFVCFSVPNTFVALCNVYVLPLAPKTKESVFFQKGLALFFVAIAAFFKIYQII